MILGEVLERFVAGSPFSVRLRVLLEQSLPAEEVDQLFEQQAQRQYQRELLFSTKIPKPERQKDKPHLSTARLLSESKESKKAL